MENVIIDKSYQFPLRIVNVYKHLCENLSKLLKDNKQAQSLLNYLEEIIKIISKIVKNAN